MLSHAWTTLTRNIFDNTHRDHDKLRITWPSFVNGTSMFIFFICFFSFFFLLVYRQNSPRGTRTRSIRQNPDDVSLSTLEMPVRKYYKPEDGQVTVSKILVHPIKSCRGTSVESAKYTPVGLENDRKWCIINSKTLTTITARDFPRMVLITPYIEGDLLRVTFPADSGCTPFVVPLQPSQEVLSTWTVLSNITLFSYDLDGYIAQTHPSFPSPSEILSEYFGKPVHLVYKGPRPRTVEPTAEFPKLEATSVFQDMYPLLVLSEEGMAEVEREARERVGQQGVGEEWREARVVIERFRPNIVFQGGGPFAEDAWEEITIGSKSAPRITLVSKCTRCLLPNVHPETGEADKAVPYKVLMKFRTGLDPVQKMKPCVGCNAVPAAEGVVRIGDVVFVKKMVGGE